MARLSYAVPEDVIRVALGATLGRQGEDTLAEALDRNQVLGTEDDRAYLTTELDRAESRWDREATPMKPVPVGSDTVPKKYDAKGKPWPVNIYLDHMNVHPIDANMGDFVKIRTGRDQTNDITGQEGTAWTADYDEGVITVYRYPGGGQLPAFYEISENFLHISYHISAGGDLFSAGQTTLGEDITDSQTGSVSVNAADRLPESGETVLVGGSEYAYMSTADHDADTVTLDTRGVDLTPASAHSSGTVIHYCPSEVREAVAMMVAVKLGITEDWSEAMLDADIDMEAKMDRWNDYIDNTIAEYTVEGGFA